MDLNIRNIPMDVMTKLKVASAQCGYTLRQYCLSKLMDEPLTAVRPAISINAACDPEHVDPPKLVKMPAKAPPIDQAPKYYIPTKYLKGSKRP